MSDDKKAFTGTWVSASDNTVTLGSTSDFWDGVRDDHEDTQKKCILSAGIIVLLIGVCCIALVLPVAAQGTYPDSKWLTDNRIVLSNCTYYATIGEDDFYDESFFAVIGNGQYNITQPAWNWTMDPAYPTPPRRYYMEQMDVTNSSGEFWYPLMP